MAYSHLETEIFGENTADALSVRQKNADELRSADAVINKTIKKYEDNSLTKNPSKSNQTAEKVFSAIFPDDDFSLITEQRNQVERARELEIKKLAEINKYQTENGEIWELKSPNPKPDWMTDESLLTKEQKQEVKVGLAKAKFNMAVDRFMSKIKEDAAEGRL